MSSPDLQTKRPARRRGLRFGVRALLLLIFAVCLLGGAYQWLTPYHDQYAAALQLRELKASMTFASTLPEYLSFIKRCDPIGEDRYREVVDLRMERFLFKPEQIRLITPLRQLKRLVVCGERFRAEHLRRLLGHRALRTVVLDSTSVTPEDVAAFQRKRPEVFIHLSQRVDILRLRVMHGAWVNEGQLAPTHRTVRRRGRIVKEEDLLNATRLRRSGFQSIARALAPDPPQREQRLIDKFGEVHFEKARHITLAAADEASAARLGFLRDLRGLDCRSTMLTERLFESLLSGSGVFSLNLAHLQLKEPVDLRRLAALPKLKELVLHGARLPGEDWEFLALLPNLKRVWLAQTDFDDHGLAILARCPKLTFIDLSGTKVTDAGIARLGELPKLVELRLEDTAIRGVGLRALAKHRAIKRLKLYRTDVDDEGLKALGELTSLEEVNLRNTAITDAGLVELGELTGLKKLNLSDTAISKDAADALTRRLRSDPVRR